MVYRDLRAVLVCCLPLTIGTFIGYWFMKELQIGLTIATLPVMVLAVGIGVDYAFSSTTACNCTGPWPDDHQGGGSTLLEVGVATIFTAITLAVGVGHLGLLGAQVPGRHGQAAGLHVRRQHGQRP